MASSIIDIAFPCPHQQEDLTILVGDVGGTKTHLALFRQSNSRPVKLQHDRFSSSSYPSLDAMVAEFLTNKVSPDRISIGVAGPVLDGHSKITNLSWEIDTRELSKSTNISSVYVINDLVANAYGIAGLEDKDIMTLHEGDAQVKGNAVIISPGTGLGEGGMFYDGAKYHPFGTEGGHADYAPETEKDIELFIWLQRKYGHVSWERVVSGMGILEIYAFLQKSDLQQSASKVSSKYDMGDPAAAISFGARNGDRTCQETMQIFLRNLANEAANLVMKLMGTGGVFIGGGIVPKNLGVLQKQIFIDYFLEAGRMSRLLKKVPVHIILNEEAALLGAALYGYYND